MKISIKRELSDNQKKNILDLLSKSFPFNYYQNYKIFKYNIENNPNSNFLLLEENDRLIAVLILLDRSLNYEGIPLKVCGMSSMAISKEFQNLETSKLIKEKLFTHCKDHDLSVGFARKVMDYYWMPYGFLGISSNCEFYIDINNINTFGEINKLRTEKIDVSDLDEINRIYNKTYVLQIGNLIRNKELWSFYLTKVKEKKQKIIKLTFNNKIVGYFIYSKDKIFELSYLKGFEKQVASQIKEYFNKKIDTLIFLLSFNHPFIKYLSNFPFSKSQRYSPQGGHILRINNFKDFLNKIRPRIDKRIKNYKIQNFRVIYENIIFEYKNNILNIIFDDNKALTNQRKLSLTRLFFGLYHEEDIFLNLLFPKTEILFPEIDHF